MEALLPDQFDLIVIGGGPGGYVAAIRAAQLGMKTAVVEREHLGGICLNWGCIPTKALLRSSEINHLLHHLPEFGFSADNIKFDLAAVVKRSRGVAKQLASGVGHLLKKNKVTVVMGAGKLAGKDTVAVGDKTLTAPHIILATGARARQLPGLEADGKLIWSYREAMVPPAMPKSLLVIGSGAIGIEFAQLLPQHGRRGDRGRGAGPRAAGGGPGDQRLRPQGVREAGHEDHHRRQGDGAKKHADSITATIDVGGKVQEITADRIISAAGIVGNVEDLGLEGTKVVVDRTHVVIDEYCRTGEPGVYAIGDIAGAPWLAHKASHEGVVCVEKIAGLNDVHPINWSNIPGCTYCRPQVASVGLTEARAKEQGHEVRVGRFPFIGNGKAIAMGEPEGMVKVVFDAGSGELLGAHMIGAEVTELIQGYAIAQTLETTETDLMHTVFPHPTVSETMHEAVLDAYGRAIHF